MTPPPAPPAAGTPPGVARGPDRGSAAVELTLATPLLVVLMLVVVAFGRLAGTRLQVNDAAHQAARAASLARDPTTAVHQARAAAQASLDTGGVTCRTLAVSTDTTALRPAGSVSVTVACTVELADLALARLPGAQTITTRFTVPVDTYRGQARAFRGSEAVAARNRSGGGAG